MTDSELADIICSGKLVSVTMSKHGCFIRSDGIHKAITDEQAEVALLAMQDLMKAAVSATHR